MFAYADCFKRLFDNKDNLFLIQQQKWLCVFIHLVCIDTQNLLYGSSYLFLTFLFLTFLFLTSYFLPLTSCLLPLTSYLLPLTSYLLPLTSYLLPLTSCLLDRPRPRLPY